MISLVVAVFSFCQLIWANQLSLYCNIWLVVWDVAFQQTQSSASTSTVYTPSPTPSAPLCMYQRPYAWYCTNAPMHDIALTPLCMIMTLHASNTWHCDSYSTPIHVPTPIHAVSANCNTDSFVKGSTPQDTLLIAVAKCTASPPPLFFSWCSVRWIHWVNVPMQ